jgi:hypothetical protein
MSAAKQKLESVVSPVVHRFLVVHVVATPDALKSGSFDRLLADHQIEFVPQPSKDRSLDFDGGKFIKMPQSTNESKDQSNKDAETDASKSEKVLVEAPASTIESCLADLNKNMNDFVSIAVDEERQPQDRIDAKSAGTRSPADAPKNLNRFSRGAVPDARENSSDLRKYFYSYDLDKASGVTANGSPRFGGEATKISDVAKDANGDDKLNYKNRPASDIRRARSITASGIDNRQAGQPAAAGQSLPKMAGRTASALPAGAGESASNQPMSHLKSDLQSETKSNNENDNLKVLFVFTPEEAQAPPVEMRKK